MPSEAVRSGKVYRKPKISGSENQRMQDGAGLEIAGGGQFNHHLHAHGPIVLVVPRRQTEMAIQLAADRADRAIAYYRQPCADVHARHVGGFGCALYVYALIRQPHADHRIAFQQRRTDRCAGPDLNEAGTHELCTAPRHECAHRHHHARFLAQERRNPRQFSSRRCLAHGELAVLKDPIREARA